MSHLAPSCCSRREQVFHRSSVRSAIPVWISGGLRHWKLCSVLIFWLLNCSRAAYKQFPVLRFKRFPFFVVVFPSLHYIMEMNCLALSTLSSMWACRVCLSAQGWQERCFAPFWAQEELSSATAPTGFGGNSGSSVHPCSSVPAPDTCRGIIPMWITHRQPGTTQHSMPWGFGKGQNFLSVCASCSLGICWWQNWLSICKRCSFFTFVIKRSSLWK